MPLTLEIVASKIEINLHTGCHLWLGAKSMQGYATFREDGKIKKVTREVFRLTHGYYPKMACHECDVRICVNPEHIYDGNSATNMADFYERSFIKRPKQPSRGKPEKERNGGYQGKMTDEIALHIRESPESSWLLAKKYGISPKYVRRIRAGEKWKPRIIVPT